LYKKIISGSGYYITNIADQALNIGLIAFIIYAIMCITKTLERKTPADSKKNEIK
jgi:hypothetical protein